MRGAPGWRTPSAKRWRTTRSLSRSTSCTTISGASIRRCASRPRWKLAWRITCGALRKSSACSGELHLAADLAYWDQAVVPHHVVTSATLSDHEVVTLRNELIPRFNHGLQQLR